MRTLSITDCGAVGDGKTDCTKAIQKALDTVSQEGGTVLIPPGVYATGQLTVKGRNITVKGDAGWGYRTDGVSVLSLNDADATCLLDITGAFGCTLTGLGLVGNSLGDCIHGISVCWDEYNGGGEEDSPVIDNCRVSKFTGDGIHLKHIWAFTLHHSMLHFNEGMGLYIDGWDGFICDNIFIANKHGGIGGDNLSSLTITANRIEWNGVAGFVAKNGNNTQLTGNYFDRSYGPAIALGGENGYFEMLSASGNIFYRNGAFDPGSSLPDEQCSHIFLHGVYNATFTGNSFRAQRGDGATGEKTPRLGIVMKDCRCCVVKDNVMGDGATEKSIVMLGDNDSCIVEDNPEVIAPE